MQSAATSPEAGQTFRPGRPIPPAATSLPGDETVPGQVVIELEHDVDPGVMAADLGPRRRRPHAPPALVAAREAMRRSFGLHPLPVFPQNNGPTARPGAGPLDDSPLGSLIVANFNPRESLDSVSQRLRGLPGVRRVAPVGYAHLLSPISVPESCPLFRRWHLHAINWHRVDFPEPQPVPIGVVDTGVDTRHPDLRGRTTGCAGFDGEDASGHGTHVAGIAAATINLAAGVCGVSAAPVVSAKVFPSPTRADPRPRASFIVVARGIAAAVEAGARVINLSLGGALRDLTLLTTIQTYARRGIVFVAASGNHFDHGNEALYPAAFDEVIAVGAIAQNKRRAGFSGTGAHLAISAPGENIFSTYPLRPAEVRGTCQYTPLSGTSMAAPQIAATAALLLAKDPGLTPADIRAKITSTATRPEGMPPGDSSPDYGAGILNVMKALA